MSHSSRALRASLCIPVILAACSDAAPTVATTTPANSTTPPASTCVSQALPAGQVAAGISGTSACVTGGTTAAEYALVAFNGDASASAAFTVTADGVTAPSALTDVAPTTSALATLASSVTSFHANRAFEVGLRIRERSALTSRIAGAQAWAKARTSSHAAYDVIPNTVTVGQILRLNANADVACGSPTYRGGRVVAITNRAIVVADTGNPAGGFTDAEYAAMGATFDTLVDPVDRAAFGDPSDIDGNGRVVMFFTKAVNDLTDANSSSYVGGFFFSRDLFPPSGTADACVGSNMGEMFYIMVPDPSRGGAFSKANVTTEVTGTLAHEYQHLINSSRRMYVNNSDVFEETWLDEGLAHIAEELLFYRASGLGPRQDIDVPALRASPKAIDAFNNYASSNFGRYEDYLFKPSAFSPYADNDSLATRGATWSFLRYAADHNGATDGTTWYKLVNSTTAGLANLQNVFGANVVNELRDWSTSVIADDVAGVSTADQQPSWNFRSIYATLENSSVFPLATVSLASGSRSVNLIRGASAYLRFGVAAGGTATVQWPSVPAGVQMSLVRLK